MRTQDVKCIYSPLPPPKQKDQESNLRVNLGPQQLKQRRLQLGLPTFVPSRTDRQTIFSTWNFKLNSRHFKLISESSPSATASSVGLWVRFGFCMCKSMMNIALFILWMPTYERLRAIFMARRACILRTFFGTTSKGLCWGGGGGGGRGGGGGSSGVGACYTHTLKDALQKSTNTHTQPKKTKKTNKTNSSTFQPNLS